MNILVVILFGGGYFNILVILETFGCLSSELYIYPTIFMPAIQNYDLLSETVALAFSRLIKTASNP